MQPKITFELGEPAVVTLRYSQGLEIPSRWY
jgi:hypothetical protein